MDINNALRVTGLSDHEAIIYKGLLASGASTVASIARQTGLHRPVVYKHVPRLQKKGLVSSVVKGKTTLYKAESPERLSMLFEHVAADFKQSLEELKQLQVKKEKPIVTFLEGKEAIRGVFYDVVSSLPKKGTFYRYTSSIDARKAESYLPKNYRAMRDEKQLERFVISNVRRAADKKPRMERSMRVVPANFDWFEDNVTMLMYGNKTAYVDYNSETATIIENERITSFHVKLFRLLFRFLT